MRISVRAIIPALAIATAISGCVSIAPHALSEKPRADSASTIAGYYANTAEYRSRGEFVASPTLSGALGLSLVKANTVIVTRPTGSQLRLEFMDGASTAAVRTYVAGAGLVIGGDGSFQLSVPQGCGGHDSPGFGCGTKAVTLFVNTAGDLAAIESGGGAGLLGIFPFAVYSKQLAFFPRIRGE